MIECFEKRNYLIKDAVLEIKEIVQVIIFDSNVLTKMICSGNISTGDSALQNMTLTFDLRLEQNKVIRVN